VKPDVFGKHNWHHFAYFFDLSFHPKKLSLIDNFKPRVIMVELRFHRKFHVELILIPKLIVNSYLNKQVCFLPVFALLLFLSAKYRFLSGLFIFKRN